MSGRAAGDRRSRRPSDAGSSGSGSSSLVAFAVLAAGAGYWQVVALGTTSSAGPTTRS